MLPLIAVMPCRIDAKYTKRRYTHRVRRDNSPRAPMPDGRSETERHLISIKRLSEGLGNNVSWADGPFVHTVSVQLPRPFDLEIGPLRIGCLFTLLLDLHLTEKNPLEGNMKA